MTMVQVKVPCVTKCNTNVNASHCCDDIFLRLAGIQDSDSVSIDDIAFNAQDPPG